MQATKGPWRVEPFRNGDRVVCFDVFGAKTDGQWLGPIVANVNYVTEPDNCHVLGEEAARANAALIAAAPSLMRVVLAARTVIAEDREALFNCHQSPVTRTVDDDLGKAALANYDAVLRDIDEVIAKVRTIEYTPAQEVTV